MSIKIFGMDATAVLVNYLHQAFTDVPRRLLIGGLLLWSLGLVSLRLVREFAGKLTGAYPIQFVNDYCNLGRA